MALNSIGFSVGRSRVSWEERLKQLKSYKDKHGHCSAPVSTGIGKWLHMQRYQDKCGKCSSKRKKVLEDLGVEFGWRVTHNTKRCYDALWEKRFLELAGYKQRNGRCYVPEREGELGCWAKKQRTEFRKWRAGKKSYLTDQRRERLTNLGFDFNPQINYRRIQRGMNMI